MKYIGIDLGTSSVKVLLLSENGIEKTASRSYSLSNPKPGYSEQNPYDWYDMTIEALQELIQGVDASDVCSISFSGQMHGLVMLDSDDNVLRPAILWNDGRATKQTDYLNNTIGESFLLEHTGNIAFAGFTAPKLLWVKENEPEIFEKAKKIMLPKDYLAYRFSGLFCTDVSDAAGTLYFDTKNRCWSEEMCALIGIDKSILPEVRESYEVIGNITSGTARLLGLRENVQIVIGAGDNAASAVGTGAVENGDCNISLGTSGTIFVESSSFNYDPHSAIHAFCSASGKYHYLACILSAASCQKWWVEDILKTGYDFSACEEYLGNNDVIFLPYLSGERSPINNANAKSMLWGMTPATTQPQLSLSILEGVAFALKQNIEIIRKLGVNISRSKICGGGAKNSLWLKIIACALNITLEIPKFSGGGSLGAALLAARGCMDEKEYKSFANQFYETQSIIEPDKQLAEYYDRQFLKYQELSLFEQKRH